MLCFQHVQRARACRVLLGLFTFLHLRPADGSAAVPPLGGNHGHASVRHMFNKQRALRNTGSITVPSNGVPSAHPPGASLGTAVDRAHCVTCLAVFCVDRHAAYAQCFVLPWLRRCLHKVHRPCWCSAMWCSVRACSSQVRMSGDEHTRTQHRVDTVR